MTKAQLVLPCFQQIQGINYEGKLILLVEFLALRPFLAVVTYENLVLHQRDSKQQF